ncbi:hypothetical protein [Streptosporangium sp. NPDC000396]|uniref:hypothetical protein n=1 Tax=Streptosporangium sp. NPDC000396 TaxID=3366185 RepID=UPI00367CBB1D
MREQRRRGLLALAIALVMGVTGVAACSASDDTTPKLSASAPGSATPSALAAPPVTLAEAEKALTGILAVQEVLAQATPRLDADYKNIRKQTRDAQEALITAAFKASENVSPHYVWGKPQLLVPRTQQSPPYWFAAIVNREDTAGTVRTAVLTLTKRDEKWFISSVALLEPGVRAPEIAKDAEGYATALDEEDPTVEISPRLMAPLHATSAEEGTAGLATKLIEQGPHTTDYATEIATNRLTYKAEKCLGYDSIFGAGDQPVRALRTADGGAMVTYSLTRTTTLTSKVEPCSLGEGYLEGYLHALPNAEKLASDPRAAKEVRTQETQLYVSTVPAKGSGKLAKVIGYLGGTTRVFAN